MKEGEGRGGKGREGEGRGGKGRGGGREGKRMDWLGRMNEWMHDSENE